jgi:hypothetical protein
MSNRSQQVNILHYDTGHLKGMRGNIDKGVCPVCSVKVHESGGTDGLKESLLVYVQR